MLYAFGKSKKRDEEITGVFQQVFTSPSGRWVLNFLLTDLGFFDTQLVGEAERARSDYAKRILTLCGVWKQENKQVIIDSFFGNVARREKAK